MTGEHLFETTRARRQRALDGPAGPETEAGPRLVYAHGGMAWHGIGWRACVREQDERQAESACDAAASRRMGERAVWLRVLGSSFACLDVVANVAGRGDGSVELDRDAFEQEDAYITLASSAMASVLGMRKDTQPGLGLPPPKSLHRPSPAHSAPWCELKREGKVLRDLVDVFVSFRNPSAHTTDTRQQNITPRAQPDEARQRRQTRALDRKLRRALAAEKADEQRRRRLDVGRAMEQLRPRLVMFPPAPARLAWPPRPAQGSGAVGQGDQGPPYQGPPNSTSVSPEIKVKIEPGTARGAYVTAQFQPASDPTHGALPVRSRAAQGRRGSPRAADNMCTEAHADALRTILGTVQRVLVQQQNLVVSMREQQRDLNRGLTDGLEEQKRMLEEYTRVVETRFFVTESIEDRKSTCMSEYRHDGFESGPETEDPRDRTYIPDEEEEEEEEEDKEDAWGVEDGKGVKGPKVGVADDVEAGDEHEAVIKQEEGHETGIKQEGGEHETVVKQERNDTGIKREEDEHEADVKQEEGHSPGASVSTPAGRKRKAGVQKTSPIPAKKPAVESPVPNPYLGKIARERARERV
ncbi:hypothetical protein BT67DRAFT_437427 [Trichocladium antarcticum]|uniref:Uncharacterized protein n=1 Tax=Trichocladium antarcticum TaxID=1450529 RepID=A0AAN6UBX1_9PEZI|nr:hypothetical protein BT67DRAFT_437427 [Trichocladium antarcticum]